MTLKIFFLVTFIFPSFLNPKILGQPRWTNLYFGNEDTWGEDFAECYDHGYLLTGKHGHNYIHYLWLIKTDVNGQILWEKTIGETSSYIGLFKLAVNETGDIFLSGGTTFYDSYSDPLILKLNACGEKEWCRVFYTPDHYDYAHSIVVTDDGGCAVILRYSGVPPPPQNDRICIARIDSEGNLLWKQCYNSTDTNLVNEDSNSLLITKDKGYLITGTCGYLDVDSTHLYWQKPYYIKADSLGNFEWETIVHSDYNLAGGDAWTTTMNPDSSYYYSSVSHYDYQTNYSSPALIKLDLEGNVVNIYDIVNGYINGGLTYAQFQNDSVLVANCVYGNTQEDITTLAVLIDTVGNILNSTELGPNIQKRVLQISYDLKLLFFYAVLQNSQYDVYLRKLNLNLEDDTLYTQSFTYDSLCPYQITSDTIVQDDCGLIVGIEEPGGEEAGGQGGMEAGGHGGLVMWPNPTATIVNCQLSTVDFQGKSSTFNFQPSTFNPQPSITIYDIFGRIAPAKIISSPMEGGGREGGWQVDVSALPPGIYLAVVRDEGSVFGTGKFVVAQ